MYELFHSFICVGRFELKINDGSLGCVDSVAAYVILYGHRIVNTSI